MKKYSIFLFVQLLLMACVCAQIPLSTHDFMANQDAFKKIDSLILDGNTRVYVDSLAVSIVPPQFSMKISDRTFISPSTTSSIQISEIKQVVYLMAVQNIKEEVLAPQGVHFLSKENVVTSDNKEGILILVSMKVDTIDFYRMMLFTGNYMRTVWVTANYPVLLKDKMEAIMRKSLLSIKFK